MTDGTLLVKGGNIVLPDGIVESDILIVDGVVKALGRDLQGADAEVLDAHGLLIFPGVIDEHVHFRDPGLTYKEDFASGSAAAAAGGVTTVLDMPNTLPPTDSPRRLKEKRRLALGKSYVDFGLYAVLHASNLDLLEEMWLEGAAGFKVYPEPLEGGVEPPGDGEILEALSMSAKLGFPIVFHAENPELLTYYKKLIRDGGREDPAAHSDSRPKICEEEAVSRILLYARRSGGRAHIAHVSTGEAAQLLKEAKKLEVKVTGETCPHYLFLTREAYSRLGVLVKINPPLRWEEDRRILWEALRGDVLDSVASDHSPHTLEEKSGDVWEASSGFIGVETLFPLMLDAALRGEIEIEKLSRVLALNPAKIFGLYPKKGAIIVGGDGDLVLVDPKAETRIDSRKLHSKHKLTPYDGMILRGKIRYTVLRGEVVAVDGEITGKPRGRFIAPSKTT